MGAYGWHYYTAYQENIEQAFQVLRQSVFASGDYFQIWRAIESYEIVFAGRDIVDMSEEEYWELTHECDNVPLIPPQTIEELLHRNDGQGTHTILDISHLITEPMETYIKVPLPNDIHQRFLATDEPDREIIEAIVREPRVWEPITKWIELTRESLAKDTHISSTWSQEVLHFFEAERAQQEMIDALFYREGIWKQLHHWIRYHIQTEIGKQIWYKAFPFSEETLMHFLGTVRPTKEDFEAIYMDIEPTVPRSTACYAVLYEDSRPSEIVFTGRTGD